MPGSIAKLTESGSTHSASLPTQFHRRDEQIDQRWV
jgi:hypothetical protein